MSEMIVNSLKRSMGGASDPELRRMALALQKSVEADNRTGKSGALHRS